VIHDKLNFSVFP